MYPPSRCVVLVPVAGSIDPDCESALRELEGRGYAVWRVRGDAAIDAVRNRMAGDALAQGFEALMWIDGDVVFTADDVDKLRLHNLPLICGLYAQKACRQFACSFLPATRSVLLGARGGLLEILSCGFGFVFTQRRLYEAMQRQLGLPVCNRRLQAPLLPYFAPLIVGGSEEAMYLGEDYSFCERARRCGFRIMADTSVRLWHVGSYRYGWEDAGREVERYDDYTFHVADTMPSVGPAFQPDAVQGPAGKPDLQDDAEQSQAGKPDLQDAASPPRSVLPTSFPRLRAYCVSYPANRPSLEATLADFRRSDWGEEPTVFMQPDDWPTGKPSASRNYRRVLEHAYEDGCDFALILEII